jgi:hypothetical protein
LPLDLDFYETKLKFWKRKREKQNLKKYSEAK